MPQRLIGERAYDSDPLEEKLRQKGVELIALHRNRVKVKAQDGWKLRRNRKRWKVERFFAWLFYFRRRLVRGMSTKLKTTWPSSCRPA